MFKYKLDWIFSLLVLCSHLHTGIAQADDYVMRSLGDHGDRIADLETHIKRITTEQASLLQEVTSLKTENAALKEEIKNLTESCCCTPVDCSSASIETTFPGTSPTTVTLPLTTPTTIAPLSSSPPVTTRLAPDTSTNAHTNPMPTSPAEKRYANCNEAIADKGINGTYPIGTKTALVSLFPKLNHVSVPPFIDYLIALTGNDVKVLQAYCQVEDDGVWLVIQRRVDGNVNFNRNWDEYAAGFGDFDGEFWLGNDNISFLTTMTGDYTLRIVMYDWGGNHVYAEYDRFQVHGPSSNYALTVGSYKGTAGDSFHYPPSYGNLTHFGMQFSTPDVDNDKASTNCAKKLQSGWWFNNCYSSNLNGVHLAGAYGRRMLGQVQGQPTLDGTGIEWYPYRHRQYSMRHVEMKIKLSPSNSGSIIG